MKKRTIIRQGDILLVEIDELPKGLKSKDKVLAYGEITGHSHRFRESANVDVYIDHSKIQFTNVKENSELLHEDHKFNGKEEYLIVPEGFYEVIPQREMTLQSHVQIVRD